MGHEQVTTKFQRQFSPYPIHRQLYMQQQHEQERRRQSLIISSRIGGSSICDTFRTLACNNSEMSRDKFVQKITKFIDRYSIKINSVSSDCTDKCIICMSNYQMNEGLRKLRCNHQFHRKCIDEWLLKAYLCPVCRSDLVGSGKMCNETCILRVEPNWGRIANNCEQNTSSSVTQQ